MGSRFFCSLIGLTIISLICSITYAAENKQDSKPNILMIISDDHGREAIGAYGNKAVRTPHIDSLAKTGVKFTQAFGTTASCAASRSVVLTGLHNHTNGQYGHEHDYHHFSSFDYIKSLPVRLEAAGYRTARIGKYHVAPKKVYHFQQVFTASEFSSLAPGERNTIGMAKAVKPFIEDDDSRPFFLYVATNDPHRDHSFNSLGDNSFGNKADTESLGMNRLDFSPESVLVPPYLPDNIETRRELAEYYQSVSRVDDTVGLLLKQLKDSGKLDNTLVVYLSDNGTAMPGAKTTVYDPGIHLPLLMHLPRSENIKKGKVVDALVSWVDITPTLLDFAGIKINPEDFHGRSFRTLINGKNYEHADAVYASHTFHEITMYYPMRVVRTKRYKLIWNIAHGLEYPFASDLFKSSTWQSVIRHKQPLFGLRKVSDYLKRPEFELYDIQSDPNEVVNLADAPDYQAIKKELIEKLKYFQTKTKDPWVSKWNYE